MVVEQNIHFGSRYFLQINIRKMEFVGNYIRHYN